MWKIWHSNIKHTAHVLSSPCTAVSHLVLKVMSTSHFWHCPCPIFNIIPRHVKLHHSSPGFEFHTPSSARSTFGSGHLGIPAARCSRIAAIVHTCLDGMYMLSPTHLSSHADHFLFPGFTRVNVALILNLHYCNPRFSGCPSSSLIMRTSLFPLFKCTQ